MPTVKATTVSADDPQTYEDAHVHAVYDEIAPHFSSTRYKVRTLSHCALTLSLTTLRLSTSHGPSSRHFSLRFQRGQSALTLVRAMGSISRYHQSAPGACGRSGSIAAGTSSRSRSTPANVNARSCGATSSTGHGAQARLSVLFSSPVSPRACFVCGLTRTFLQDYAISIATIHHLATPERRRAAVKVREPL